MDDDTRDDATVEDAEPEAAADPLEELRETDPDEFLRRTDGQAWVEANDTRPRTTAHKAINLAQLDAELGGHGLAGDSCAAVDGEPAEIVIAEGSPVTLADLTAAIDAHVAEPPPPAPLTAEEQIAAALAEATDFASFRAAFLRGTPSP